MSVAHGGQIVCSSATARLAAAQLLPADCSTVPLSTVRLKGLEDPETVHGIIGPGLESGFPALRAETPSRGNLPSVQEPLIGRGAAVAEVAAEVAAAGVVTLTGPGGVGKTTLAIAAAMATLDTFPDGVWAAELALAASGADVGSLIMSSVGVREQPGEPVTTALPRALAGQKILLVLDNCEHVLGEVRKVVTTLRHGCPTVHVLATSRERLGVAAEREYVVKPLELDGDRPAAVELFLERTQRAGYENSTDEVAAVAIR